MADAATPPDPATAVPTDLERAMRRAARMLLLASMLEATSAAQLDALARRVALENPLTRLAALQAQVERLTARLGAYEQGPLLSSGAFGRIQGAQRDRDTLRDDLRRLRERYADAADEDTLPSPG